jgi:Ca-activated chloride channel family protein
MPQWLWALLAVLALAGVLIGMGRVHAARLGSVFSGDLLERVWPRSVRVRRVVRDTLMLVGLALLVLALAEPRFGKRLQDLEAEGVDLVLVLDLSNSMNARDVDPSRLERARREILDLIEMLQGDRVGLVIYAGGAYPRMPLTLDYSALELLIRETDTRTFQAQGSALDAAIRSATELLQNTEGEAGKAILVVTDGEVHRPDDALVAAEEAAAAGASIFGLVIGSQAAPIPNADGTWVTDPATRQRAMSTPTTEVLTEMARISGGAVVQSVASNQDVARLYGEEIRGRVRSAVGRTVQREAWNTAFHWPLGVGAVLLLLSSWIGDGRSRGVLTALFLSLLLAPSAQAQSVREADALMRDGQYERAVDMLTELSLERPDDADLFSRLGTARYRAGDYEGAARAFSRESELSGGDADAEFNAGNAWFQSGQLDRAMERYERAISADEAHEGANRNRELVAAEIQQRRVQQQQQQQQQQQGGEEGGEPQEGEQSPQDQDGEQEGQQGQGQQDQEGQPDDQDQQGDQQGQEGQQGQQEQSGNPDEAQDAQASDGDEAQPDDGTREDEGDSDGQTKIEDVEGFEEEGEGEGQGEGSESTDEASDEDGSADGGEGGEGGEEGDMDRAQAERVLDGVEEGRPRVVVPGEGGEKPW